MMKIYPTQKQLLELFNYDLKSGTLTWKASRSNKIRKGMLAGTIGSNGYRRIQINGHLYLAHRLIWIMQMGKLPINTIDHKNRIPDDNRWENLREATNLQQNQNRNIQINNKSGVPGVSWNKNLQKWQSFITLNSKQIYLGVFSNKNEAIECRKKAEHEYFRSIDGN